MVYVVHILPLFACKHVMVYVVHILPLFACKHVMVYIVHILSIFGCKHVMVYVVHILSLFGCKHVTSQVRFMTLDFGHVEVDTTLIVNLHVTSDVTAQLIYCNAESAKSDQIKYMRLFDNIMIWKNLAIFVTYKCMQNQSFDMVFVYVCFLH